MKIREAILIGLSVAALGALSAPLKAEPDVSRDLDAPTAAVSESAVEVSES